ncbi:GIY-YIG nuclease family protein [Streptomyces sp. MJP52]|uniref:GIY-YIG nuclease family protein n=1 Tax=Streptomyces sp. MJP52 TaxID=2940555 RepID=UPI00247665B0|nr:GIY-YIG nuclease family protein [Streptomyces sp. MJP52]MDH6224330.1 hypothetical protein [Streptomyces sp. MJP52]
MSREESLGEAVVYVIGTPGSNTVKIGRTTNLQRRLADIQRMSPVPLVALWTHPGGHELETRLHHHFAELRSHGEWFAFDGDPLPAIKQAAAEAIRPRLAVPSPRRTPSPADKQKMLDLISEAAALHRMKREELETAIAEARAVGVPLTAISQHTPFSREWVRRIADRVDREKSAGCT